jgi:hypothetical protein
LDPRVPSVINVHRCTVPAPPERVARLIDALGSPGDVLWPRDRWPALWLEGPLQRGTKAGHGPLRYFVQDYSPGKLVRFRFTAPEGFDGTHEFVVERAGASESVVAHVLRMNTFGSARLAWLWFYKPLHNVLIEDALHNATAFALRKQVVPRPFSLHVRSLRWLARKLGMKRG